MATQTGLVDYIKRGAHDDHREGIVLAKIAAGQLVATPFPTSVATFAGGTGTVTSGVSTANPDGGAFRYTLTVPVGQTNSAGVRLEVWGRTFGLRFRRPSSASAVLAPFTVKVDGVIRAVRNSQARRHAQPFANVDDTALVLIAEDLPNDGPHTVEISVASDLTGGVSRSVTLYGLLVEASKGYAVMPQIGVPSKLAITTSATSLTSQGLIRKLRFGNTTGADRTVTIADNSGATFAQILVPTAVPKSAEYDFGVPVDLTGYTVTGDATGVNMFIITGSRPR